MLSSLLLAVLLSAPPSSVEPATVAMAESTATTPRSRDVTAATAGLHSGGEDPIFEDGFESGTWTWSDAPTYTFFSSGPTPSIDLSTCNLRPGVYTLRLDADRLEDGTRIPGHTCIYTMTVSEQPCFQDPSGICLSVAFSDPSGVGCPSPSITP